jgi:hypothetical protein
MKYLSQDSINSARDKCKVCAQIAELTGAFALPFIIIWLATVGV